MEKLKLEHLSPYLPYGLSFKSSMDKSCDVIFNKTKWTLDGINKLFGDYCLLTKENNDAYDIKSCQLILRPLSDLTKEIEHKGDKFVPIIEIAKLYASTNDVESIKGAVTNFHYFKCYYGNGKSDYQILIINDGLRGWFSYYFNNDEPNCGVNIVNEWEVREKLLEWHFDVFGLIDKGLAVDINAL